MQPLFDKTKRQVFLYACPANIPLSFASHSWFITNKKGVLSRWEVLFRENQCPTSWGHLHKNFLPPFQGIEIFPYSEKYFWGGTLLGHAEDEVAEFMIEHLESSPTAYPYCYAYDLRGPNSNTYTQSVLDAFPGFPASLPWNSFGKGYRK
jgi:hypothetical protein